MPPMAITDPVKGPESMTFTALPLSAQQMLGRPKTRDMTGAAPEASIRCILPPSAECASISGAGTGRYPPEPKFHPYNFYSCVRLGDKDQLELVRWLG